MLQPARMEGQLRGLNVCSEFTLHLAGLRRHPRAGERGWSIYPCSQENETKVPHTGSRSSFCKSLQIERWFRADGLTSFT